MPSPRLEWTMNRLPWAIFVLAAAASPLVPARGEDALPADDPRIGNWKNVEEDGSYLRIEPGTITFARKGLIRLGRVLVVDKPRLGFFLMGSRCSMLTTCEEGVLITRRERGAANQGEKQVYRRVGAWPEELEAKPWALGQPASLPPEEVEGIRQALKTLDEETTPVEIHRGEPGDHPAANTANAGSLRRIVQRVGWIDAGRFGAESALRAARIAHRSEDVRLMLAALPFLQKDLAEGRFPDREAYAFFFDRLQLLLGRRQTYGTQNERVNGKLTMLPLEDEGKVDEFRKQIGLPPLGREGREQERTAWKAEDWNDKVLRLRMRKALFALSQETEGKTKAACRKVQAAGEDPAAEQEAVRELEAMGKDGVAGALNFLTADIKWGTESGRITGCVLFEMIARKARELWGIETESVVGMFESADEIWEAIAEMKFKILVKEKTLKTKE
jgi:hypothetical protein